MQIPARKKLWQYPRVRFAAALLLGAVLVMLLAYILSAAARNLRWPKGACRHGMPASV